MYYGLSLCTKAVCVPLSAELSTSIYTVVEELIAVALRIILFCHTKLNRVVLKCVLKCICRTELLSMHSDNKLMCTFIAGYGPCGVQVFECQGEDNVL